MERCPRGFPTAGCAAPRSSRRQATATLWPPRSRPAPTPSTSASTTASTRAPAPRTSRRRDLAEVVGPGPPRRRARSTSRSTRSCSSPSCRSSRSCIRRVAAAGADAIIVQDPAVALLARAICPQLEVHASTQMTASSPLAAELLAPLGLVARRGAARAVGRRDPRVRAPAPPLELEVFVHGALCVAWSGQCLSSRGVGRPLREPRPVRAGVPPALRAGRRRRASATSARSRICCRRRTSSALDAVAAARRRRRRVAQDRGPAQGPALRRDRGRAVSRRRGARAVGERRARRRPSRSRTIATALAGRVQRAASRPAFSAAPITRPSSRAGSRATAACSLGARSREVDSSGANERRPVGRATATRRRSRLAAIVPRAGMGVVFDAGTPEEPEQGGPIFAVVADAATATGCGSARPVRTSSQRRTSATACGSARIRGSRAPARRPPRPGAAPLGRIAVALRRRAARAGAPLEVAHRHRVDRRRDPRSAAHSTSPLAPARGAGITRELLADKLGAFGGTPFHLGDARRSGLAPGLHLPVSRAQGAPARARRRRSRPRSRASIARVATRLA